MCVNFKLSSRSCPLSPGGSSRSMHRPLMGGLLGSGPLRFTVLRGFFLGGCATSSTLPPQGRLLDARLKQSQLEAIHLREKYLRGGCHPQWLIGRLLCILNIGCRLSSRAELRWSVTARDDRVDWPAPFPPMTSASKTSNSDCT